mgnify:FL=1
MLRILQNLFKPKANIEHPYEYLVLKFSDSSQKEAHFEDMNKEIEHWEGNNVRIYSYSEELIEVYQDRNVPIVDRTTEEFKIRI